LQVGIELHISNLIPYFFIKYTLKIQDQLLELQLAKFNLPLSCAECSEKKRFGSDSDVAVIDYE
jgi:hypothetical protein